MPHPDWPWPIPYASGIKGTPEDPYVLIMPKWMADMIEKEKGMSAQEYADVFFRVAVKVTVV